MQAAAAAGGSPAPPPPPLAKLCELRPSISNNVHSVFILLEKGVPARVSESGPMVSTALVADATASVHFQLWGAEVDAFQPGDIIRLTSGMFSFHKSNLILRAGKKGTLEKVGEFSMVFTETPNMSRLQWAQDPSNPKSYVIVGYPQSHPSAGQAMHAPGSGGARGHGAM
eukprot:SM000095S25019  [mRNA]  locus=s95:530228:531524:- [translate_table: standard]